ncbi:MAG: hypothetical protein PVF56_22175 [Desulfobacterales bacterium]|jgi:hypothetical protein
MFDILPWKRKKENHANELRREIDTEILPELWLLNRYGIHINAPFTTQKTESMAIASIKE